MAVANRTRNMAAVNRNIQTAFVDVLQTDAFVEGFSLDFSNIPSSCGWVKERDNPETRCILSLMTEKSARRVAERTTHKPIGILVHINESSMKEMGTEQVCQRLR